MMNNLLRILLVVACCLSGPGYAHPGHESRLEQINALIKDNPGEQTVYILRATEYSRMGEWDLADRDFNTAANLGDASALWFEQGRHQYRQGHFEVAYQLFNRYSLQHPNDANGLLYQARSAAQLQQWQRAFTKYRQHFNVNKNAHPGDYLSAAQLLASHHDDGIEQALQLLDQGLRELGNGSHLQRFAVELELRRGEVQKAIQRWRDLQPMLGESPAWKVDMAKLLLADSNNREADLLLAQADSQLQALRITPARIELLNNIKTLREQAEHTL
ncbi:hypothetical protein HBA55_00115 [Pseudomaricurvus alkylphenolicus]|uniref:tetratricopeptide repeat protein n=1 Tax=Pseudomaricurvus alkylphenolicus TaxID=1306991 RepID=UPI0014215D2B|nr:hypothetical protein [Pseudomaricurvus alkylphenolicus]NIB37962.1 hypothetical protein [Pseudomaricurvus alkylphenolicus]